MPVREIAQCWRKYTPSKVRNGIIAALSVFALTSPQIASAQGAEGLKPESLNVANLNYEKELIGLYLGDFANVGAEPERGAFPSLFSTYVTAFARQCADFLPSNRVEMTEEVCVRESTPVNGFGLPVGATTCVQYRTVGTGLYADPELLAIAERLSAISGRAMLGDVFNRSGDPGAATRQLVDVTLLAGNDMQQLLKSNACNSPSVKRLQDNMVKFSRGAAPLRLASGETLADIKARAPTRDASKPVDYARLIDDLIAENSRGWMLNVYSRGGVRNVDVQGEDSQGRPSSVRADYRFSQLGQATTGSVRLTFHQGLPKCLYFYDAPSTCRVASPRIANAYERGEY